MPPNPPDRLGTPRTTSSSPRTLQTRSRVSSQRTPLGRLAPSSLRFTVTALPQALPEVRTRRVLRPTAHGVTTFFFATASCRSDQRSASPVVAGAPPVGHGPLPSHQILWPAHQRWAPLAGSVDARRRPPAECTRVHRFTPGRHSRPSGSLHEASFGLRPAGQDRPQRPGFPKLQEDSVSWQSGVWGLGLGRVGLPKEALASDW